MTQIIKNRSTPGILLFDLDDRLLFSNGQALDMLPGIDVQVGHGFNMPSEIFRICRRVKGTSETAEGHYGHPVMQKGEIYLSLRGFMLVSKVGSPSIMILIEQIVAKHEVNIEKIRQEFLLTKREADVVRFLCRGMGNKKISEEMFISEHTVKDHIKNVMKKIKVGSRNELMAFLK